VGTRQGSVEVYSLAEEKLCYSLTEPHLKNIPVTQLRWRDRNDAFNSSYVLLASYSNGTIIHWHVTAKRGSKPFPHDLRGENQ
jgi:hypothetical protein